MCQSQLPSVDLVSLSEGEGLPQVALALRPSAAPGRACHLNTCRVKIPAFLQPC